MFIVHVFLFYSLVVGSLSLPRSREVQNFFEDYRKWVQAETPEDYRKIHAKYMMSAMDKEANPCDDFHQFACGNWGQDYPQELSVIDPTFYLHLQKRYILEEILSTDADEDAPEYEKKAKTYFQTCMNSEKTSEHLEQFLRSFGFWPALDDEWSKDDFNWFHLTAEARRYGLNIFYELIVGSLVMEIENLRTAFFVPRRPNYWRQISELPRKERVSSFKNYIENILDEIVDESYLRQMKNRIVNFEYKLHRIVNHKPGLNASAYTTLAEFMELLPEYNFIDFLTILKETDVDPSEKVFVANMNYMREVKELLETTNAKTVADYIFFRIAESYVGFANFFSRFYEQAKAFNCIKFIEEDMNEAVTALFINRYFQNDTKHTVLDLALEVGYASFVLLNETSLIDDHTKNHALKKFMQIEGSPGYHDFVESSDELDSFYADLDIDSYSFLYNRAILRRFYNKREMATAGKNTGEEIVSSLKIGASFRQKDTGLLRVHSPFAQPPVFHKFAPKFVNYGGLGSMIGHEFWHAFDTKNVKVNGSGVKTHWYSEQFNETYADQVSCYVSQYNNFFDPVANKSVNGTQTINEILSDSGAYKASFRAFNDWLQGNPEEAEEELELFKDLGITAKQLFFVVSAQLFCDKRSAKELLQLIETGLHPPGRYRSIGPFANYPEFAKAYECPLGSPMNPIEKCTYILE